MSDSSKIRFDGRVSIVNIVAMVVTLAGAFAAFFSLSESVAVVETRVEVMGDRLDSLDNEVADSLEGLRKDINSLRMLLIENPR